MPAQRIASYLANLTPVPAHKPWPRYPVDGDTWTAIGQEIGQGGGDLMGYWGDADRVHLALRLAGAPCVISTPVAFGAYPSIARHHAPAGRLERTIRDLHGFAAFGMPDRRPWLDHGAWGVRAPLGEHSERGPRDPADYDFLPVKGEGLHEIPVGPVHAGIIEPGHFRFTANGETVARLEERLGYVHKGVDALLIGATFDKAARVIARVSGDSTVAYSFAFARAVEAALDVDVPLRAEFLRGVMAELERIANHLGDIGAISNDAAFALIHAHCGILREQVLAVSDAAFGHRLMMDQIVPGGIARDVASDGAERILAVLNEIEPHFTEIVRVYDDTPSLQDRTCGTGIVAPDLVARWAAGGFVGRASGRNFDTRRDLSYAPYLGLRFDVPVYAEGDVNARVWVRIREVSESIGLIRAWLTSVPVGAVRAELPNVNETCEGMAVVEAFRGDVLVCVRVGSDGRIAHCYARDPSWFQWPLLEAAIDGNIVADFPLCNKSFNCSYSGHDV
ncbi:MAG: hydrogenase expression protein HypE [Xanthobacteraceae bacterium]